MLRLRNFVVSPGSRPGERTVYARLSDGSLRKVQDPALRRAVLLKYDTTVPAPRPYWRRWHNWYALPLTLGLLWLVEVLGLGVL